MLLQCTPARPLYIYICIYHSAKRQGCHEPGLKSGSDPWGRGKVLGQRTGQFGLKTSEAWLSDDVWPLWLGTDMILPFPLALGLIHEWAGAVNFLTKHHYNKIGFLTHTTPDIKRDAMIIGICGILTDGRGYPLVL